MSKMLDLKIVFMLVGIAMAGDDISSIQIEQNSRHPAIVGHSYSLLCNVVSSGKSTQIDWRFSNGTPISENDVFRLEGDVTEVLKIKEVRQSHNGLQFTCSATDVDNSTATSQNYTLIVFDLISSIQIEHKSQHLAIAGHDYSLLCRVVSPGYKDYIEWRFSNSTPISESEVFELEGNASEILTIRKVQQSHNGLQVTCSTTDVDNSTVTSQNYTLTVIAAPEIRFFEDLVYTQAGKAFYKDCAASGYPFPVVKWYQSNKEVLQQILSVSHSLLVIPNIAPRLHENYTCKASVSLGNFVLRTNKTFTLMSYDDVDVQVPEEEFTNTLEYKYTVFVMVIMGCVLIILVPTVISCRNSINGNCSRDNKFEKDNEAYRKYIHDLQSQKPVVYDEILKEVEKNTPIPKLPKKGGKTTRKKKKPKINPSSNAYEMPEQIRKSLEKQQKEQLNIYEDVNLNIPQMKIPCSSSDPQKAIASSDPQSKAVIASSGPQTKVVIASSDPQTNAVIACSDPQTNDVIASSDPQTKVVIASSDPQKKAVIASSDPQTNAVIARSDSEMKIFRTISDPQKAVITRSDLQMKSVDAEVKVPRARSDPRIIACRDSEMKVPSASFGLETPKNIEKQLANRKLDPESIYHL